MPNSLQTRIQPTILLSCLVLGACASSPNTIWFENAQMNFEVLQTGPSQYNLTALGAGAHKAEQVIRAFGPRAQELCAGGKFSHPPLKADPYQYNSSGGGMRFTHQGFKVSAIISCG